MTETLPGTPGLRAPDAVLAAEVARRHYLRGESKVDIAAALGLSRFKVARLLEAARTAGIVRIEIVDRGGVDSELSREVREAYGLQRCVVVDCPDDPAIRRAQVGAAGAEMLADVLRPGDVLGLPWARTLSAMVDALPELPPVHVVQLSGSMVIPGEHTPVDVVRAAAALAGGEAHVYYAPFILDDASSAAAMRRQPAVAGAFAQVPGVTVAAVSVGAWRTGHSTIHDAVPPEVQRAVLDAGAVGEALGVFFDAEGGAVHPELADRMVTIGADELRGVRDVVALATGTEKTAAVRALLLGRWAGSLVVDHALGRELARLA